MNAVLAFWYVLRGSHADDRVSVARPVVLAVVGGRAVGW